MVLRMKLDIDFMVILFQCTQRNFFHTKGDVSVRLYKLNYFLLKILLFSYFDFLLFSFIYTSNQYFYHRFKCLENSIGEKNIIIDVLV